MSLPAPGVNRFKSAIAAGQPQIGLWQALASPYTAEICAAAGFDWLLIDGEHAPNDVPTLLSQLQAVAPYPVEPVLRPPIGDPVLIKQYLDFGARSLLIPMVEDAAQAEALVRATRYPPHGMRGVGASIARAGVWGRRLDYLQAAEREICLLLQVETARGLTALDAIASVDGVDGIFIGPADLAASLGHLGDPGHPEIRQAIDQAMGRIIAKGKAAGILTLDQALADHYLALGARFVAVGTDVTILAQGADALVRRFKGEVGVR